MGARVEASISSRAMRSAPALKILKSLSVQVLLALVLGLLVGALAAAYGGPGAPPVIESVEALGGLWLNALRMTVIPLIFAVLVSGIAQVSDAAATGGSTVLHHTEASTATATRHALESGLDVIFQSSYEQHRPYLAAFRTSGMSTSVIDSAVARVLRAKFAMGLFEAPYGNADSAAALARSPAHRALAREAAVASFVLLRNERSRLPLAARPQRIALIGSDATEARVGGYSPPGARAVSIAEGVRAALPAGTKSIAPCTLEKSPVPSAATVRLVVPGIGPAFFVVKRHAAGSLIPVKLAPLPSRIAPPSIVT